MAIAMSKRTDCMEELAKKLRDKKQGKKNIYSEEILIVDDEVNQLDSLKQILDAEGFHVTTSSDAASAITLLESGSIDLLLLDLNMPDVSGVDIMRHIREGNIDTTVIVVSGESTFEAAEQALKLGAYDFVRKPYSIESLLNSVRNAFNKRALEYENTLMQSRLLESESLHRFVVNKSPDIVYMLDEEGRFTFVNERMEHILGFAREEVLGKHYTSIIHDDDIEVARYTFNERRTGSRATANVELRLKCKDGGQGVKYFESRYKPITINSFGIYKNGEQSTFLGTYGVARDITDKKENEKIIYYQAYHDTLTGLPNRALLKDRLEQSIALARRNNHKLSVMFLDLDRFKNVNDTMGHLAGDKLLREVANRLRRCIRECDTLSRIGGDEFTILLPEIRGREDSTLVAQKILHAVKQPFYLDGEEIFISTSIGIAHYPENGTAIDTLLKHADIAMYAIKNKGKDGFQFYTDDMHDEISAHIALENELRRAIHKDQFRVYYQPQVDAITNQVVALEALLRWDHPEHGIVLPSEFIPVCEEIGLIESLGDWIMERVCKDINQWNRSGLKTPKIAINMSAKQFENPEIAEKIKRVLKNNNVAGEQIEIEITENVLMEDMDNVVNVLNRISALGIRIAIDDFGTGYSSLQYLQKLPIHTLKIDRSFVQAMEYDQGAMSIIKAIIAMAKGLRLQIISEGVEQVSQWEMLKDLGCNSMQGYLFSQPVSLKTATELLSKAEGWRDTALH